jgi:hypothetical protein
MMMRGRHDRVNGADEGDLIACHPSRREPSACVLRIMVHLAMTGLMARRLADENAIFGLVPTSQIKQAITGWNIGRKRPLRSRKVGRALPASDLGGAVRGRIGPPSGWSGQQSIGDEPTATSSNHRVSSPVP